MREALKLSTLELRCEAALYSVHTNKPFLLLKYSTTTFIVMIMLIKLYQKQMALTTWVTIPKMKPSPFTKHSSEQAASVPHAENLL